MWYRRLNEYIEDRGAVTAFLIVWLITASIITLGESALGKNLSDAVSSGVVIGIGAAIGTAIGRPKRARRRAERTQRE